MSDSDGQAASNAAPEKKLGTIGLAAIVVSSMVGGGIFSLPQNMAEGAGALAVIIAWIITGIGIYFIADTFRILSAARPNLTAGIYMYSKEGFGNYAGFTIAWGYWLCQVCGNVGYAVITMDALNYFFPGYFSGGNNLESIIGGSLLIWFFNFVVLRGVHQASVMNLIGTVGKLVPLFVFLIVMAFVFNFDKFSFDFLGHLTIDGEKNLGSIGAQIKSTMLVTLWAFIGIEGAVVLSGRAKSQQDVGRATILGFSGGLIIFALISILPYGFMTQAELAAVPNPSTAGVLEAVVGPWGSWLMNIGLIIAVLASWLAWTMITAEIPYDIEAVIVIPSQKTSFLLAYALDQYLLRGGRVLLLVDPYSEEKRLSLGASNNIDKLLKSWGASINFSNVIGNINIGEKRIAQNRGGEISYTNPLWLNLTPKNINTSIPFNKNISTINLRSAGNILLNKQERIKATPVFYTTQNSGTIETADLGLIDENELMQKFQKDNKTYNLSILLEGKADSAFTQNPLQNTGLEQDMLPFLPTSIKDGKLLLIADTDFLTDTAWINEDISGSGNTYDIVSYAQNGEFVLRALDYLTDAVNLSSIGSKQLNTDNLSVSQKIYQKKLQPYKAEYEQNKKHLAEKEELNKVWNEIVQNNETAVNMSMLKKIEQNKQEINNLKENLKKT